MGMGESPFCTSPVFLRQWVKSPVSHVVQSCYHVPIPIFSSWKEPVSGTPCAAMADSKLPMANDLQQMTAKRSRR
jgi:hypothetical protein